MVDAGAGELRPLGQGVGAEELAAHVHDRAGGARPASVPGDGVQ